VTAAAPASASLRSRIGCWANERWRLEVVLRFPRLARWLGLSWLDLCNRHERLQSDPLSGGRICPWPFSSELTVARVFPETGARLLRHCLEHAPVDLGEATPVRADELPEASIILGVRGTGRMPQFQTCVRSLLAQKDARVEVIVVEQSWRPEFEASIPAGVRYLHQQCTSADMPYNRSWALNGGARIARGRVLILQDADMLMPERAVAQICRVMARGLDALRLPRLIFYLDQAGSEQVQARNRLPEDSVFVEKIAYNTRTPLAVTREAYADIGGHDEAFYGWGCEDDEFMARLRTRAICEGTLLPIVHLWHASAAAGPSRERNIALREAALARPLDERIVELRARDWGASQPSMPWPPASADAVELPSS